MTRERIITGRDGTGPDDNSHRTTTDYRPLATGDVATATAVVDGPIGDEGVSVIVMVNGMESPYYYAVDLT